MRYKFTRFVMGGEHAEGVVVNNATCINDAVRKAVGIVYTDERPVTVLVLDRKYAQELEAEIAAYKEFMQKLGAMHTYYSSGDVAFGREGTYYKTSDVDRLLSKSKAENQND